MNCEKCKTIITPGEENEVNGQILCEDCYMDSLEPLRTCDVASVHSTKKTREMLGQTGTDGLTEIQKDFYEFVKEKGQVTKPELLDRFQLPEREVDNIFAILRHCELLKGKKENGVVYVIPFE